MAVHGPGGLERVVFGINGENRVLGVGSTSREEWWRVVEGRRRWEGWAEMSYSFVQERGEWVRFGAKLNLLE